VQRMQKTAPNAKPGKPAKPNRSKRPSRLLRVRGRPALWRPIAIYIVLVVLAGAGIALWDHFYQAQQAALYQPPPPQVMAKDIIESIVGRGTVHGVSVDAKTGQADLTVEDVLTKPGQSAAEVKKNLTAEGTLTVQALRANMPSLKTVTIHLVKAGKPLATARLAPGQKQVAVDYAAGVP
jgi:hypothetical protein